MTLCIYSSIELWMSVSEKKNVEVIITAVRYNWVEEILTIFKFHNEHILWHTAKLETERSIPGPFINQTTLNLSWPTRAHKQINIQCTSQQGRWHSSQLNTIVNIRLCLIPSQNNLQEPKKSLAVYSAKWNIKSITEMIFPNKLLRRW